MNTILNLPLSESDAPRIFALGKRATAANLCDLYAIVPDEDTRQINPLVRYSFRFVFHVFNRYVDIVFCARDLNALPEHVIIGSISEVLKNDRRKALYG